MASSDDILLCGSSWDIYIPWVIPGALMPSSIAIGRVGKYVGEVVVWDAYGRSISVGDRGKVLRGVVESLGIIPNKIRL
jgi:hypothetical protein